MEKTITIIVGDNSAEFGQLCSKLLIDHGFQVKTTAKDGNEVLEQINAELPDVVIIDAYMKNLDAIAVMKRINDADIKKPMVIVTSAYDSAFIQDEVMRLGAAYFILRPFDLNELTKRITDLTGFVQKENILPIVPLQEIELMEQITHILYQIGVPARSKSYEYVREGIRLAVNDPRVMNSITKVLYPSIAEKFSTTSLRVERGIRHAIEVTWLQGDIDALEKCFGYTPHNLRNKPSNSEFIAVIAGKLSLDRQKRNIK